MKEKKNVVVRLEVKMDREMKELLEAKAKSEGLDKSKVIRDLVNDYLAGDERIGKYVVDKDRKVVKTFCELNNICSSITEIKLRNRALYLLGELQCLY